MDREDIERLIECGVYLMYMNVYNFGGEVDLDKFWQWDGITRVNYADAVFEARVVTLH